MNWQAVGAIGEILGALAVLITLVYLSKQIRQNTRSMDETRKVELARNRTQTVQLRTDWMLTEAGSDTIVEMYERLNEAGWPDPRSLEILTPAELGRLRRLQRVNVLINTNARYQHELGLIDDASYQSSDLVLKRMKPAWVALGFEALLEGGPDA
jgi:hypothetical protein